jgi:hypothetical protein
VKIKVILTAMTGMIVAVSTNLPSYTRSHNYVTCVIFVVYAFVKRATGRNKPGPQFLWSRDKKTTNFNLLASEFGI